MSEPAGVVVWGDLAEAAERRAIREIVEAEQRAHGAAAVDRIPASCILGMLLRAYEAGFRRGGLRGAASPPARDA